MNTKKNGSVIPKTLIVSVLAFAVMTSACSTASDGSTIESPEITAATEEPVSDDSNSNIEENTSPIDFSVIKEYFFGVWAYRERPDLEPLRIGYGDENFSRGTNRVTTAYIDDSGNAIMDVIISGQPKYYMITSDNPDAIYVLGGDSLATLSDPPGYIKTGEVDSKPTSNIFGYFDMLEYNGADVSAFYNLVVTLDDGSRWKRLASMDMDIEYPTLYLVQKDENSITLRSLFYPEGTELTADSASLAREINFTVGKGWHGAQFESSAASSDISDLKTVTFHNTIYGPGNGDMEPTGSFEFTLQVPKAWDVLHEGNGFSDLYSEYLCQPDGTRVAQINAARTFADSANPFGEITADWELRKEEIGLQFSNDLTINNFPVKLFVTKEDEYLNGEPTGQVYYNYWYMIALDGYYCPIIFRSGTIADEAQEEFESILSTIRL